MKTTKTTKVAKATLVTASIIFISLILTGMSYAYNPENVMAMWLLDEDGGDIAKDSSGNGNDGTLNGGPKWVEGKFGSALEFDGSDDNVEVPDHETLDTELSESLTVVLWMKMYNPDEDGGFLVKEEGWENKMCYRFFCSHGEEFGFMLNSPQGAHPEYYAGDPDVDTWYHVAAVYNGSKILAYVDGELVKEFDYNKGVADTDARVFIGSGHPDGEYFNGIIDEVALFNTVLTEDDIKTIMNDGLEASMAVSPGDKLATTWGTLKVK